MSVSYIPLRSLIGSPSKVHRTYKPTQKQNRLRRSLIKDGLLNPLRVKQIKSKYFVLDGKKRLRILRDLARSKLYARALYKIPCILDDGKPQTILAPRQPALMTDMELVHEIAIDLRAGKSRASIADRFDCAASIIQDVEGFKHLHDEVLRSFNNGAISLAQAAALSTISNREAQWRLLQQIGPFASQTDIVRAIRGGETVLELPDGNTLILPTRKQPPRTNSSMPGHPFTPAQNRRIAA